MKISHVVLVSSIFAASVLVSCNSSKDQASDASASEEPPAQTTDEQASEPQNEGPLSTIYFDFNKFNIRQDQMATASQLAQMLKATPERVQIQGNCDDRGSAEYNMALGQRRAQSLKKYLVASGIPKGDIETISFGKEHPVATGDTEQAWALNRRDEVVKLDK